MYRTCWNARVVPSRSFEQMTGQKMTYRQFACAVELMTDSDKWNARYKTLADSILKLVAATERRAGKGSAISRLEYDRVVNAKTGKPGKGLAKQSRLVTK